jgi:hypothetical protein
MGVRLGYLFMEISISSPFLEKSTEVGRISTTLAPGSEEPSDRIEPLTAARRFEGSSYQIIADNLSSGAGVPDWVPNFSSGIVLVPDKSRRL